MNYALLVGINKYLNDNIPNLKGCCNDVDNMEDVFISNMGCHPDNVVVLKDEYATYYEIVRELKSLVKKLGKGDIGFFHFSGHGSQSTDIDGDEVDRVDELICPHDMSWAHGAYITDDKLGEILGVAPEGVFMEVFLDSCHSGTATRDIEIGNRARTIKSPYPRFGWVKLNKMKDYIRGEGNHILWSGCTENQLSSDAFLDGKWCGAFTHFLARNIRKYPNISRQNLLSNVHNSLKIAGFNQTPQLEIVIK